MMFKKVCFLFFISLSCLVFCQEKGFSEYYWLRKKYEHYEENDAKALQYVRIYIDKAKEEKNHEKLMQGYRDGIFYSPGKEQKLKYADSIVWTAKLSQSDDLMSTAYLEKGVVYYYHYKKYQSALDEYLKAYQHAKNTKDNDLKNKIFYHLGVVKSYLGYEDAESLFQKSATYFEQKSKGNFHPNEIYNYNKGYLNSIHQLIIFYEKQNNEKKADSLITAGLKIAENNPDYLQEKAYFLKSKGISDYKKKLYSSAINNLKQSLSILAKSDDFASSSVDYFYLGKSYSGIGDKQNAIYNFQKVDSVFQKNKFILPTLRENYEQLINYYKKEKNKDQQLYYTTQLLKADSIISKDFAYLPSKIHKEYDTETLLDEKRKLEKVFSTGTLIIFGVAIAIVVVIVFFIIKNRKEKRLPVQNTAKKIILNQKTTEEILEKLKIFEDKKEFTEKKITLQKLALKCNTNPNYLSQVINDEKKKNFSKYIGDLRINYITLLLSSDKKYLNYTIDSLAEESGFTSRQNFSDMFFEVNGIRPKDFIRKRKQEV